MTELHPWQQRLLTDIKTSGLKPGEMAIMTAGRGVGKSMMTAQAIERLMQDIMSRPVEDLVLSEGRVYGARYYLVEPVGGNWLDMETWCLDTYGSTGSIWQESKNLTPEPLQRWYMNNRKFWFRKQQDRDWFILRWRS